ncbi:MAG: head GIN domain-containing protein [Solirubrobacteraceae bacterium]
MIRTTLILITSAAAVAVAVAVIAGGVRIATDGPHTVQTRRVGTFDRIDLRDSANVVVTRGNSRTLTVSGGRNRVRDVVTRVQSGTLVVEERDGDATIHLGDDGPTVTVSAPSLVSARLDGSGDLFASGLTGGPLQVRVDGSGDVEAHGRLDALNAADDGSGDLNLGDLVARSAKINLSGSGDADVHAVRTLAVVVSGSGDVSYAGNPEVTRDMSGSGDVSHR